MAEQKIAARRQSRLLFVAGALAWLVVLGVVSVAHRRALALLPSLEHYEPTLPWAGWLLIHPTSKLLVCVPAAVLGGLGLVFHRTNRARAARVALVLTTMAALGGIGIAVGGYVALARASASGG